MTVQLMWATPEAEFTAAQAAQKNGEKKMMYGAKFTAAQAAQKNKYFLHSRR